jgi:hypothetical protein
LKSYCEANTRTFDEKRYDSNVTDIINQKLKGVQQEIKIACQETGDLYLFKKSLAPHILKVKTVLEEIEFSIGLIKTPDPLT